MSLELLEQVWDPDGGSNADWFDADRYPTARFVSARVTQTGPRTGKIAGTLTLRGVSKPIEITIRCSSFDMVRAD